MVKTLVIVLATLAILAACANEETVLRNAAGEERYCYLVHDSTLARISATDQYNKCLNDAGAAGFKRVGTKSN
jgi:hypothetical protein